MNHKIYAVLIISMLTIGSLLNVAVAQDTVRMPDYGKLDSLNSTILKQERLVQVFVPPAYKPGSSEKYNVLYVLDGGNWNTGLINTIRHLIEGEGRMPPLIVVSVLGIDRNHDLTPTRDRDLKTSGGANNFLSFFKNELIPYIDKKYPADGDNVLWGHSFAGLFVVYALLNEPQLFKSYVAIDPSILWDNTYLAKITPAKLTALPGSKINLFIAGREGEPFKEMKTDTMQAMLKKYAPASLNWKVAAYADESHGSLRLKGTYDGLKFVYNWYNANTVEFHPQNGIIVKDMPIKLWYFNDTTKVRYTTNGTEPLLTSARVAPDITIFEPGTVTLKRFTPSPKYDRIFSGQFKAGTFLLPVVKLKNSKPGGFHYAYYEGTWDKLPDFKNLKAVKQGVADTLFSLDKLPRKDNFALLIDGYLEVKEEGYHVFILDANDGAKLFLNNQLLLNHDSGVQGYISYIVPLKKGFYPIRIEYFQKDGIHNLDFGYAAPSELTERGTHVIPFELEYSEK